MCFSVRLVDPSQNRGKVQEAGPGDKQRGVSPPDAPFDLAHPHNADWITEAAGKAHTCHHLRLSLFKQSLFSTEDSSLSRANSSLAWCRRRV